MGSRRKGLPAHQLISATLVQRQERRRKLVASCFSHIMGLDAELMRATINGARNMLVYFLLHLVLNSFEVFYLSFSS